MTRRRQLRASRRAARVPTALLLVALGAAAGTMAGQAAPRTPSAHSDSPRTRPPAAKLRPADEAPGNAAGNDGFGRWDMPISACQLKRQSGDAATEPPLRCQRVRLDQQLPGLLSIRFITPASPQLPTDRQMVFAGLLQPGSAAMQCHDGSCEPRGAMRLQVSAVAETGFQPQGTLLQAQLARGQCQWQERHLRCEAASPNGARWWAEASR